MKSSMTQSDTQRNAPSYRGIHAIFHLTLKKLNYKQMKFYIPAIQ